MKQEGITLEQAILKKSYVQICSLSTEQSNFSYKDLATLLNIFESNIEEWAIEAIANKIIDAKIDQMNKYVVIKSHKLRQVKEAEWRSI